MPPIGGMMSDAQVADVVNYVRTHFGNAYPDACRQRSCGGEATGAGRPRFRWGGKSKYVNTDI